jgi:hypothetical protein
MFAGSSRFIFTDIDRHLESPWRLLPVTHCWRIGCNYHGQSLSGNEKDFRSEHTFLATCCSSLTRAPASALSSSPPLPPIHPPLLAPRVPPPLSLPLPPTPLPPPLLQPLPPAFPPPLPRLLPPLFLSCAPYSLCFHRGLFSVPSSPCIGGLIERIGRPGGSIWLSSCGWHREVFSIGSGSGCFGMRS